ncbi:hypothetical protein, partial [Salmonella sp. s54925]|uniref:hypothetical protein n=1 Tax=Salmonella sp. s54925 TaxID=3159674 RepID=UPI003980172F
QVEIQEKHEMMSFMNCFVLLACVLVTYGQSSSMTAVEPTPSVGAQVSTQDAGMSSSKAKSTTEKVKDSPTISSMNTNRASITNQGASNTVKQNSTMSTATATIKSPTPKAGGTRFAVPIITILAALLVASLV